MTGTDVGTVPATGNPTGIGTDTIGILTGLITGPTWSVWLETIWGTIWGTPGGGFIFCGIGGGRNWFGGPCTGCCIWTCMGGGSRFKGPWTSGVCTLWGGTLEDCSKGLGVKWLAWCSWAVGFGAFSIAFDAIRKVLVAITGLATGFSAISCSNLKIKILFHLSLITPDFLPQRYEVFNNNRQNHNYCWKWRYCKPHIRSFVANYEHFPRQGFQ